MNFWKSEFYGNMNVIFVFYFNMLASFFMKPSMTTDYPKLITPITNVFISMRLFLHFFNRGSALNKNERWESRLIKRFVQALSQKEKSMKELYQLIVEHGYLSKNELMTYTGITSTTCSRLINEMIQLQLITESGYGESSGGRKPILYNINPQFYHLIGIDINRSVTKVLLLDLNLTIKSEASLPMNENTNPDVVIHFIESTVHSMLQVNNLEVQEILGIGIGTIGPLDQNKGIMIEPSDFPTDDWINIPIVDLLEEKLGINTFIDYGINTAILAEIENKEFKEFNNIVYIIKDEGTRVSLKMDRFRIQGSDNFGMFNHGHMIVDMNGKTCDVCGNDGCIEAYSSISSIKKEVILQLEQGKESILQNKYKNKQDITFEDIYRAVNNNDPLCSQIIKGAASITGIGISNIANIIHPGLIILSGPTYTKMDLFYQTSIQAFYHYNHDGSSGHHIAFSKGLLGDNAAAIGAATMVFNYYLS